MKMPKLVFLIVSALLTIGVPVSAQSAGNGASLLLEKSETGDAEAIATIRKNAAKDDAAAQFSLGILYDQGKGVPRDFAEAAKWFRKAADQGYAMAQNNLGVMYANGRGVAQSDVDAEKWYRLAAMRGYAMAQNNLGLLYANGRSMVSDLTREVRHGVVSEYRPGVPQNDAEAATWYRRAADQGYAPAQFNLGVMLGAGRGVPKDDVEAAKWYRKAAEQGDAGAQFNLGARYNNGRGVPQDNVQAYKWWTLSKEIASAGSDVFESAAKNRDILAGKMSQAEIETARRDAAVWTTMHSNSR